MSAASTAPGTDNDGSPAFDFISGLPPELLVRVLEAGEFSAGELAAIRLVNHALCAAASSPGFYREIDLLFFESISDSIDKLYDLPDHVAGSVRHLSAMSFAYDDLDLGKLAHRTPHLTTLVAEGWNPTNVAGLPISLRELFLDAFPDATVSTVEALTNLEALHLGSDSTRLHIVSVARLARLRRLRLPACDLGAVLAEVAASPCAATLEAINLGTSHRDGLSPGWWEPLLALPALTELRIPDAMMGDDSVTSDVGGTGFYEVLAGLGTLDVLAMVVRPNGVAAALERHGLPASLRVLSVSNVGDFWTDLSILDVLPASLCAIELADRILLDDETTGALLTRCPHLSVLKIRPRPGAIETFVGGAGAGRALLLGLWGDGWSDQADILADAGHTLVAPKRLDVGVHWRLAGGVFLDGEPVSR